MSTEGSEGATASPGDVAARFVAALAAQDEPALAALIAPAAVWTRPGSTPCTGRDAVLAELRSRGTLLQQAGPLRVTRSSEVAWPSTQGAHGDDSAGARVDVVDIDDLGLVRGWLTIRADEPTRATAARRAALERYVERVGRADAEAALTLFAGQCDVEDPVGTPAHRGRAAVEAFYRTGLAAITSTAPLSPAIVSGDVGAIAFRVELTLPDRAIALEVIDVMTFDQDDLFTSMRAFWGRVNRLAR